MKNVILILFAALFLSCFSKPLIDKAGNDMVNSPDIYTLVNIHVSLGRGYRLLRTVNYIGPGVIPMCTKVTILDFNRKKVIFLDKTSNIKYNYYYHRSTVIPFEEYLNTIFGRKCDSAIVKQLSILDRQGIKKGKALLGMSKEGVKYALGYPPMRSTPTLKSNTWKYWESRFNTMLVKFQDGIVTEVKY